MSTKRKWLDFLFFDNETGEEFFVELDMNLFQNLQDAIDVAKAVADENFDKAVFQYTVCQSDAEIMGLDTY